MRIERITFISTPTPQRADVNKELQWIASTLGLFNERDKDSSCFRIFITILKSSKQNMSLTSDQIASITDLSRGTVIHHINKLREMGLVVHQPSGYCMSDESLEQSVARLENEVVEMLRFVKAVARDVDKRLGQQ